MNLTDILQNTLADLYEASIAARSYHWNVEGPNFSEYHEFFDVVYSLWYDETDRIAEYIRIVSSAGVYVRASTSVFSNLKKFETNPITGSDFRGMIEFLIKTNSIIRKDYLQIKDSSSFPGLSNYCDEYVDKLDKLQWKLKAYLK